MWMASSPPRPRIPVTRRVALLLTIMIIGAWTGTACVVIGALLLHGHGSNSHLLIAGGLIGYTLAGVAAALIRDRTAGQRPGLAGRVPLGTSRLVRIVIGSGVLLALIEVAFALMPSLFATYP